MIHGLRQEVHLHDRTRGDAFSNLYSVLSNKVHECLQGTVGQLKDIQALTTTIVDQQWVAINALTYAFFTDD